MGRLGGAGASVLLPLSQLVPLKIPAVWRQLEEGGPPRRRPHAWVRGGSPLQHPIFIVMRWRWTMLYLDTKPSVGENGVGPASELQLMGVLGGCLEKTRKGNGAMKNNKKWLLGCLLGMIGIGLYSCSNAPTDESITQAIQSKFFSDPQMKSQPVQVSVSQGEATLSGDVPNEEIHKKILEVANAIPGVKKVNDSMSIHGVPAAPKTGKDQGPATPRMAGFPAGTVMEVQMIDSINSRTSQVGSSYRASLAAPLTEGKQVIVPKGADVFVKLVHSKAAGHIKGSSELTVSLDRLEFQGQSIALDSSSVRQKGASRGKQTATRTALGAGAGALIGGLVGGGKGAAIGAGVGGGGAIAVQAATHGKEVRIPSETRLDFTLAEPIQVQLPSNSTRRGEK